MESLYIISSSSSINITSAARLAGSPSVQNKMNKIKKKGLTNTNTRDNMSPMTYVETEWIVIEEE